ncbi:MAG: transketolase [Candidatus Eisenbacteria bacterium]|uniref:Transketolase n=1 Tax=Eiseniibacteriota bacterium TaxID=2212470 RepID=A0A956LVL0_UNCEI|nr:transketolase [Candidatus Eisenbacteria bacterium]
MTTSTTAERLTQLSIDTIRTLSMDAVQAANSGHPGTPMALAPLAYYVWGRQLRFDPDAPDWLDRDRFVLSNGHASALLYSMLHLCGYGLGLDELKQFRQWNSRTPGHPERGHTPGIEVTTGPLGQGVANAVGLAMAEQMLAARFNRPGHAIIDHHTFAFCGDGCLMEGISYEAASLAGHLGLGKLICYYDDNHISIAGSTKLAFTEDVAERFDALGWHTARVEDINDLAAIQEATEQARAETMRPSLILVQSVIGYGSPHRAGTKEAHGEPLGEEEVRLTKRAYAWPEDKQFFVPDEVRGHFEEIVQRGRKSHREWASRFEEYRKTHPTEASELERVMHDRLPAGWEAACTGLEIPEKAEATRSSGGRLLQRLAAAIPELVGGSADLDPSTKTFLKDSPNFDLAHRNGRNVQYGVREHAMGAIVNGMAAHGGLRPFGATFFVFSDYMRPTIRLAALSHLPSIFVFTHDSIGLGEDGPTHEPIEHLASLRAMPNLVVSRPADARETAEAWQAALARTDGPTVLVLSRQNLPQQDRSHGALGREEGALRGGYVLRDSGAGDPEVVLIATGSEVAVAIEAAGRLEKRRRVRVVSLPSWELFEAQDPNYRSAVLGPDDVCRITIEAGATMGWERYRGARGACVGVDRFGASAPGETVMAKLGITADRVVALAEEILG